MSDEKDPLDDINKAVAHEEELARGEAELSGDVHTLAAAAHLNKPVMYVTPQERAATKILFGARYSTPALSDEGLSALLASWKQIWKEEIMSSPVKVRIEFSCPLGGKPSEPTADIGGVLTHIQEVVGAVVEANASATERVRPFHYKYPLSYEGKRIGTLEVWEVVE